MKQLPIAEIEESAAGFLQPIMERLPDKIHALCVLTGARNEK
jgi:hypothetical protein